MPLDELYQNKNWQDTRSDSNETNNKQMQKTDTSK